MNFKTALLVMTRKLILLGSMFRADLYRRQLTIWLPINSTFTVPQIIAITSLVTGYSFMLLWNPVLGSPDDVFFFKTLEQGKFLNYYNDIFPYLDIRKFGRLTLFAGWEYNVALLFGNTAVSAQIVHAVQYAVFVILGVHVLRYFTGSTWLGFAAIVFISFSPGFLESWFQRHLNERNLLLWLVIYLFCRIRLKETRGKHYVILAILSAFVAVNYRETAFIPLCVMSVLWLAVMNKSGQSLSHKFVDTAVLVVSFLYITYYFIEITPQVISYQFSTAHLNKIENFSLIYAKAFVLCILRDPLSFFTVVLGFPFLLYKRFCRNEVRPGLDLLVLLAGGGALLLACWVLMLFTAKYTLITLFLSLPGVVYLIRMCKMRWLALLVMLLPAISLLKAPYYIEYYLKDPSNFNQTIEFLASRLQQRPHSDEVKTRVYVPYLYAGHNTFLFIHEFLVYKGAKNFDLLTMNQELSSECGSRISLLGDGELIDGFSSCGPSRKPQRGDLILVANKFRSDANMPMVYDGVEYSSIWSVGARSLPGIDLECVARYVVYGAKNIGINDCGESGRHNTEFSVLMVN